MLQQNIVIGVDESHADSVDAIQSGLIFLTSDGKATLYSVVNKAVSTEADVKKRLEKAYKDVTEQIARASGLVGGSSAVQYHAVAAAEDLTIAQSIIKEAGREKATMIAIGAGRTTSGALGSVANEIVLKSHNAHVVICKRHRAKFEHGKGRTFLIAIDGSIASRVGLKELISLCKAGECTKWCVAKCTITVLVMKIAVHA